MVPPLIVGLEKPYLKGLGLREIFGAHTATLNVQGPLKDLTLSPWWLASIHELPRETVWKIAERLLNHASLAASSGRSRLLVPSLVPSWRSSESRFGLGSEFPDSLSRRGLLGNSGI
jgi:hypothetical protein